MLSTPPSHPESLSAVGERFAVSAGCPEATAAALDCLRAGGNVVDAALAGSAVLCVVLPHAVTIGGDLFGLVKLGDQPIAAVNAAGAAPRAGSIAAYAARGHKLVPVAGPLSIQTPGLVAGWQSMAERWASRPLAELLAPATGYARNGFQVGARLARLIAEVRASYWDIAGWRDTFAPGGRMLEAGDRFVQAGLARTLERIAAEGARGFYSGAVARDMARSVQDAGGFLSEEDLEAVKADIGAPLSLRYREVEVLTQPPISQGAILLRALGLLMQTAPDPRRIEECEFWSHAARALRQAFDERLALLGDGPDAVRRANDMLAGRAAARRPAQAFARVGSETTTLSILDASGNAVSIILSVFADLGSGVVARESGVLFNNRLSAFFLHPAHPNHLAPGRRTMHTLHSFIARDAKGMAWVGGSPGGDNQPQVNLQVLARLIDLAQSPAAAVAAPRWAITPGTAPFDIATASGEGVNCEPGLPQATLAALAAAGFTPALQPRANIGSAKLVGRGAEPGSLAAWADRRREGAVAAL